MSPNNSIPGEMDYDIVDLQTLSIDSKAMSGEAVLCDLGGNFSHIFFTYTKDATEVVIMPLPYTSASALLWLSVHGMADLFDDAKEALQVHNDWLGEKDTMGKVISWTNWSVS